MSEPNPNAPSDEDVRSSEPTDSIDEQASGPVRYVIVGAVKRVKGRQRRYAIMHPERRQERAEAAKKELPPANVKVGLVPMIRRAQRAPGRDMSNFP